MSVVKHFWETGVLSREEAQHAFLYVGKPENDRVLRVKRKLVRDGNTLGFKGIEFGRMESVRFCDWILMNEKTDNPELVRFLYETVRILSIRAAYKLNENTKENKAKGLAYFADAVAANAFNILFGSSVRRIIKVEHWKRGKPVSWIRPRRDRSKKYRNDSVSERVRTMDTVIINGQFRCTATALIMDTLESEKDEFFVIGEHRYAHDCYTVGRKVRAGSSLTSMAIGMSRASFVRLEVGPSSGKTCELIAESRESRRSRNVDTSFDVMKATRAFCESLEDKQASAIMLVELDRPHEETSSFEFYVARTGDNPHRSSYYYKLAKFKDELYRFLEENRFRPTWSKKIMTRQFRNSEENSSRYIGLNVLIGESEVKEIKQESNLVAPYCPDGSTWAKFENGNWEFQNSGIFNPDRMVEYADYI